MDLSTLWKVSIVDTIKLLCTCVLMYVHIYVCNIYVCQRANSQMNSSASNCVYSSPCSFTSSDDTDNDLYLCSFLPISTMKSSRTFLRMHNWVLPGLIPNRYVHMYLKMHNAMYDTNNCIWFKPLCMECTYVSANKTTIITNKTPSNDLGCHLLIKLTQAVSRVSNNTDSVYIVHTYHVTNE